MGFAVFGMTEWTTLFVIGNVIASLIAFYFYNYIYLNIPSKASIFEKSLQAAQRKPTVTPPKATKQITKKAFSPELVPDNLDVIVIGSGIGGLTTGNILAKAGYKVLVLEQHTKAGGSCHTFKAQKHFEYDTGIHFVGKMDANSSTSKMLNMLASERIDWVSHGDPFDSVTIGNTDNDNHPQRYEINIGEAKLRQMLLKRFPEEEGAIERFLELLVGSSNVNPKFNHCIQRLDKPMGEAFVLGKCLPIWFYKLLAKTGLYKVFGAKMSIFFELGQSRSVDVLDCLTKNEELKSLLLYLLPAIGFDTVPSTWYITSGVWQHYLQQGSWYPIGGSGTIVNGLVPTILAFGGEVLMKADVTSILLDSSKKVMGVTVQSNGKTHEIRAPLVVSGAGIHTTFSYYKYADLIGASLHLVFVGLDGDAKQLGLDTMNHHFMSDSNVVQQLEEYSKLSNDEILDAPLPFYSITFPSAKDPEYVKRYPGKTVCTMAAPTNHAWYNDWNDSSHKRRPDEYKQYKQTLMYHIWAHALKHYPHLENRVEYIDMATPLTVEHYLRSYGGSVCSMPHDHHRFSPGAVAELRAETDITGLYLTGQDILSGGFSGAFSAAWFASEAVLKKHGFKK